MYVLKYIYTVEYYLSIKRNGFELALVRWMNPEPVHLIFKPKETLKHQLKGREPHGVVLKSSHFSVLLSLLALTVHI